MAVETVRPQDFSGIVGHESVINYFKRCLKDNTLPQFLCLYGEPGLGKSNIAKILASMLTHATEEERTALFKNNGDTPSIKTYKMSIEGGINTVKEAISDMDTGFTRNKVKVVILEEAHRMAAAAQDALLTPTEYLKKGVYVIMTTTDIGYMNKAILSRCTKIILRRLKRSEMFVLLDRIAERHRITFEPRTQIYDIISTYSENRPRDAIKVVEDMGWARKVVIQEVKDFLNIREPEEAIQLIRTLGESLYEGLQVLFTIKAEPDYQRLLVDVCNECLRVKNGMPLLRYEMKDVSEVLSKVDGDTLLDFLYETANIKVFDDNSLLAAFLRSHPERKKLSVKDDTIIEAEQRRKSSIITEGTARNTEVLRQRPTLERMFQNSKAIEGEPDAKKGQ